MLRRTNPLTPRALGFALALAAVPGMAVAQSSADICPLGAFVCPVVKNDFALCKKNDLLKFYVPGLPKTGNRDMAPTHVDADRFTSPDSNIFHLSGNTSLQRLDQLLRADSLTYHRDTTAYDAEGHVRYQDRGLLFSASRMQGTTAPEHGVADNVQYQLLSSRGNGVADQATVLSSDQARMHDVTYSTCALHHRIWDIEASTMTMDRTTGRGHAWNVTMRLKGVPFLWLPYMSFPIDNKRHSGFLFPTFGKRSRAGTFFSIPFYWNIAPNFDATLTPVWYSERGLMTDSQFRFLTSNSKGQLNLDYIQHDKVADRNRGYLTFSDRTRLPANFYWTTSIAKVTDKGWFQDYNKHLTTSVVRLIRSSSRITGSGNWWNAGIRADWSQITDPDLPDSAAPFRRMPSVYFNADLPIGGVGGPQWGVNAGAVRYYHPEKTGGDRFNVYTYLTWPLQGAAWFFRPELGLNYTTYNYKLPESLGTGSSTHPSRSIPIFDIDTGLIFERQVHFFGQAYTQTLEPRVFYLRVPYRNQSDLPNFDSRRLGFDFWQLFATNLYSGIDRQSNANNLSVAVTTRFLDQDGVDRLSASIGQTHYFDPQKVKAFRNERLVQHSGSDYAGNLSVALNDNWRLTASHLWNVHTGDTDVSTVGLQRRLWDNGIVNFSYRYRRDQMEQTIVSAIVPISPAWKLVTRYNYSMLQHRAYNAFIGVEWDSCCTAIRLLVHHYIYDDHLHTTNALMFQIEFKGVGAYGQSIGSFVQNAILGYQ